MKNNYYCKHLKYSKLIQILTLYFNSNSILADYFLKFQYQYLISLM